MNDVLSRFGLRLLVLSAVLGSSMAATRSDQMPVLEDMVWPQVSQCELALEPTEVDVSEGTVNAVASLSEPVGEIQDVSIPGQSGVEVVSYVSENEGEVLTLTLGMTDANEGEWNVTVRASEGGCTGTLTVTDTEENEEEDEEESPQPGLF